MSSMQAHACKHHLDQLLSKSTYNSSVDKSYLLSSIDCHSRFEAFQWLLKIWSSDAPYQNMSLYNNTCIHIFFLSRTSPIIPTCLKYFGKDHGSPNHTSTTHILTLAAINKNIANDCVISRHCKHFHSPIFSNRFIFSVSILSRAAKPHGAWNKIYALTRHFITLISYCKLPINHFPLWSYIIFVKISEKICLTHDFI